MFLGILVFNILSLISILTHIEYLLSNLTI